MEDITERFDQASPLVNQLTKSSENISSPDHAKIQANLLALWRDLGALLQELNRQLELVTDPNFDAFDEWQAAETKISKLQLENSSLRKQLKEQQEQYEKQLRELTIHNVSIEEKRKNERHEAKRRLKSIERKYRTG
jgi:chromosome segregation ATPase